MIRFFKLKTVFLPLLGGIGFSLLCNLLSLDWKLAAHYYDSANDTWAGEGQPLMDWLYNYGVAPALIVAVLGLFGLLLGYYLRGLQVWRKICLYLFLVLALGNGLIANAILKEYWGRPRPSQVEGLGGTQAFEPSLWIDLASSGKSFPCGHCTMGFYFFAVALLLRGRARVAVFIFSILFGSIIGLSRISYGGHFLSDVVWAGVIMWVLSLGLQRWLRLDQQLHYIERPAQSTGQVTRRKLIRIALIPITLFILIGVALRTPRDKTDCLTLELQPTETQILELELRGTLKIQTGGDELKLSAHGQGFGFPKTKLHIEAASGERGILIYHKVKGLFTDLRATTSLQLPAGYRYEIDLQSDHIEGILQDGHSMEIKDLVIDLRL